MGGGGVFGVEGVGCVCVCVYGGGGGGGFMHGHNPAPEGRPPLPAASHN